MTQPQARSCATVAHDLDDRVICTACRHLWPGNRCLNHRRADLNDRDLAADFTVLPQRCPGYAPKARAQAPPMHTPAPTPKTETKTDDDRRQTDLQPVQPIFESDNIMSLTVSEGASAAYTPPEAGTFTARCCRLIDLGSQTATYEGETKTARKILIAFEITDPDNRRDDGQPFVLSKRFTASLHPKAGLRKFLESWRGRPFTPEELKAFDLRALLGVSCLLGIVHQEKGDRVYANLSSCMKLPKGMTAASGTEPLIHLDLSAMDWTVYAGLSPRLAEQIALSPEFQALTPPRSVTIPAPAQPPAPPPAAAPPAAAPAGSGFDDMDDDIPF